MAYLAVFLPLFSFVIIGLFGRQMGDKAAQFISCTGLVISAALSCFLFYDVVWNDAPRLISLGDWIAAGNFAVDWTLRIDTLTAVMMCVINIVSACVHIYSVGYMSHDSAKGRFMAYLSLFTFAMLMLVTSDNLLQLFFGWEGVGLASYLLIGFWNTRESANKAAIKAFVVNRVGDFGLTLGIMTTFVVFGSISFDVIFENAPAQAAATFNFLGYDTHALTLIGLLLFIGAMGKSAQLGLHTWLPDAMEGPTPVSALIHAATMVTAGVFLVARFSPLYEYAPIALMVVCVVGALTAIIAATIGMTQFDIKRVIAYSTMSQLGYMFFALGVSAYGAAIFHLMTHAFFKALLFLGAGSVIHAIADEQDMRNMGGLWKKIPFTYAFMWIGGLALAGMPFFAGYFSKDMILEAAYADHTWFGEFAFWMGIGAALLTAFYTWRLIIMTFHGKPRAPHDVMHHAHESPAIMLVPLAILAAGAIFAGWIFYQPFVGTNDAPQAVVSHAVSGDVVAHEAKAEGEAHESHSVLSIGRDTFWGNSLYVSPENDTVAAAHHVPYWVKKLPIAIGLIGILLATFVYGLVPAIARLSTKIFMPLHRLFFKKWYFDEIYHALIVVPVFKIGALFWKGGDQATIDGFGPDGVSSMSRKSGRLLSQFQVGYIFHYAFVMMVGVIGLVTWIFIRMGGLN
ncbi:MAG: NADH-quinone oxidoreductase subunit L [Micavibrio sp.]|nr:NADH-quinone oxidoreductase subunit L [Micavibrio sp.]|tara:strand:- start:399456 stop:401501 length:2046 start_codon:yes stop_codon:yes gene_type:complete